jgi:hypothetical protein
MVEIPMPRRTCVLVITLILAILMALLAAAAQPPAKMPLIGSLATGFPSSETQGQPSPLW